MCEQFKLCETRTVSYPLSVIVPQQVDLFVSAQQDGVIFRDSQSTYCTCNLEDPVTGFKLPSIALSFCFVWTRNGMWHNDSWDPITGFTLPAVVIPSRGSCEWYHFGQVHNDSYDFWSRKLCPAYYSPYESFYFQYGTNVTTLVNF